LIRAAAILALLWTGIVLGEEIRFTQLPVEARATLELIKAGGPFPYRQDGRTFSNREKRLPQKARGYYREYTVRTPGERDRGARRAAHRHRRRTAARVLVYRRSLPQLPELRGAAMMDVPDDESPPLLQLLPLSSEAGAYRVPEAHLAALLDAADELGFQTHRIDLAGCRDTDTLFTRLAQALEFPEYFGHNWDALADCLADLEWLGDAAGYLLLLEHGQALQAALPDEFDTLIEIIDSSARGWHEVDVPFWGFLSVPDDGAQ
jgi:RNAse (barnase) inhibitor barstar